MSVFVVDMIGRQYKFLHNQSRQQALSLANELAVAANTHVLGNDFDGLERVIQNYKNFPELKYAMIVTPDNEVLSHTDISYVGKKALDSVSQRIGKESGSHILLADDEIVDAVAPVTQAGSTIAWARVAISQDYIYGNLKAILRNGVIYILLAIAMGILVGILMGNRLTRGLYKLVAAAEKIRAGDRSLRAADSDSFEVGHLATAFNQMLDEIDANESRLESNLTASKDAEMAILRLNRVYQFISQINQLIVRAVDEETILREACRIAIEYGKFRMAWVGVLDAESGWITPTVWSGYEDGYLKDRRFSSLHRPEGAGSPGQAVRTRSPVYYNDIANDPLTAKWRDDALARGYRSSITFPLFAGSSVVSILIMYMDEPFFFTDMEIKLLKEVTDNISFALDKIRLRRSEERSGAELKESEEKFRTLVEQSQVGVYILQDSKFVYTNPLIEQISGYSTEELMRMDGFYQIVHKEDRELAASKYENRIIGLAPSDDYVLRVVRKDGTIVYIQTIASKIIYRNEPAVLGSVIDITDKQQESKRVNKAVIAAQEKERIQIGMELHDNIQQILAGAMLTVDYVFASYEDRTDAFNALSDIKRYLGDSIVELRRISHQLAPSTRFERSLEDNIRALVETMNIGRWSDVRLEIDPFEQPLSQEIQLAFYRILQEQLTNILNYAHASLVSIRLKELEKTITLSIKDNGQGFDPATKKSGIGLENIRRRVAALEGEMKIVSSVGNGCELLLQVPAE